MKLAKDVQDMYMREYKVLLKEIKRDLNKWGNTLCSCLGRLKIIKMSIFPQTISELCEIPVRIPADLCL